MRVIFLLIFTCLTFRSIGQKTVREFLDDGFQENGKKAIRLYSHAIKLDSGNAEAYWRRGDEYYRIKRYDLALKDLNKSLKIDSNFSYAQVISDRGQTLEMLRDYNNAISDFTSAINYALKQDTTIPQSLENYYYHRGRSKLKNRDTTSAMADLDSALHFWDYHQFARKLRAKVNTSLGNYSKAMQDYNYLFYVQSRGSDFPLHKEWAADFYYRGIAKKNTGDSSYKNDLKLAKRFHYYPEKIIYIKGL